MALPIGLKKFATMITKLFFLFAPKFPDSSVLSTIQGIEAPTLQMLWKGKIN